MQIMSDLMAIDEIIKRWLINLKKKPTINEPKDVKQPPPLICTKLYQNSMKELIKKLKVVGLYEQITKLYLVIHSPHLKDQKW